jgi:hypothetical protein
MFVHSYTVTVAMCYIALYFNVVMESLISEYHTERQTGSNILSGTVQKVTL